MTTLGYVKSQDVVKALLKRQEEVSFVKVFNIVVAAAVKTSLLGAVTAAELFYN